MSVYTSPITPAERVSAFLLALLIPSGIILGALASRMESARLRPVSGALVSVAFTAQRSATVSEKAEEVKKVRETGKASPDHRARSRREGERRLAPRHAPFSILPVEPHRLAPESLQTSFDFGSPPLSADSAMRSEEAPPSSGGASQAKAAENGSAGAAGVKADKYGQAVLREIRRAQHYATRLQRRGIAGTVVVAFTVDRRGRLRAAKVVESSGSAALDDLALHQLTNAAPFPRPPESSERHFRIPMTYRQTAGVPLDG